MDLQTPKSIQSRAPASQLLRKPQRQQARGTRPNQVVLNLTNGLVSAEPAQIHEVVPQGANEHISQHFLYLADDNDDGDDGDDDSGYGYNDHSDHMSGVLWGHGNMCVVVGGVKLPFPCASCSPGVVQLLLTSCGLTR